LTVLKGVQAEVPLSREMSRTLIFMSRDVKSGYGWLFPKGRTANAGIGACAHAGALLESFLEYLTASGLIRPGVFRRTSGLIPVSGMRERLVYGNTVLAGDAAGFTHPITGAGVAAAVISGTAAGKAAAECVKRGSMAPFTEYEREMRARFGGVLAHARAKRRVMEHKWDETPLAPLCERTWIAAKGYRTREPNDPGSGENRT
jgi:flavin-dependent dehydrogenase